MGVERVCVWCLEGRGGCTCVLGAFRGRGGKGWGGSGRAVGSGKGGGVVQSCSLGKLWI